MSDRNLEQLTGVEKVEKRESQLTKCLGLPSLTLSFSNLCKFGSTQLPKLYEKGLDDLQLSNAQIQYDLVREKERTLNSSYFDLQTLGTVLMNTAFAIPNLIYQGTKLTLNSLKEIINFSPSIVTRDDDYIEAAINKTANTVRRENTNHLLNSFLYAAEDKQFFNRFREEQEKEKRDSNDISTNAPIRDWSRMLHKMIYGYAPQNGISLPISEAKIREAIANGQITPLEKLQLAMDPHSGSISDITGENKKTLKK